MPNLSELVRSYGAYHRDWRNKLTHVAGVPLVTFSLLLALSWLRLAEGSVPVTGGTLFYAGVLLYYLRLDPMIAMAQAPFTLALLYLADCAATLSWTVSVGIFAGSFVGGWIIQLIGHYFEGRRPALADNIWQVFNAPLFLTVELFFWLGLRPDLRGALDDGPQSP